MKLPFPESVLRQHLVTLGKTGAGKSSTLRLIVEDLLRRKKRACIVDIKGDWWGLKSSADGKSAGFPVIAFGNFRNPKATDVPINAYSGQHVAELIATGNRPCVIGFRGWMPHEIRQFWIGEEGNHWSGFASTLFNKNEGELYVVISECHNFAPKGRVDDPKSGRMLHWTNKLLSEGRGLGMTFLLDSQRPQKVHNDTLTSCETLVAMRLTYPADREAVQDWIKGCGDKEIGAQVMNTLAQMARGEAWVWSPENGFGPERIKFPMFQTFDSFAPAQLQKTVSDSGWSSVDLEAVKIKLATVIEEQKANDPAELKRQLAEAKRELAKRGDRVPEVKTVVDEKQIARAIIERDLQWREATALFTKDVAARFTLAGEALADACNGLTFQPPPSAPALLPVVTKASPQRHMHLPTQRPAPSIPPAPANGHLPPGERKVLIAAAQYEGGVLKDQLSVLTCYKKSSRNAYILRLSQKGLVEDAGDRIHATADGVAALGTDYEPLPTGDALRAHWFDRLPEGERKVLEILIDAYPAAVSGEAIEEATSFKKSTRNAYLQRLGAKRLVEPRRGEAVASATLFD